MKRHWKCENRASAGAPRSHRRRGATIAEFAITAPLFFVLLFAGVEFAVLSTIRSTANNAAYEGARKLVIPGADAATGIQEVRRIMAIVGVRNLSVTVTPSVITEDTSEVTVDVAIPYDDNAIITPWFTGGVVVNTQSRLRTERYGGVSSL